MITEIRYFTPAEARKTLPLVRKIVKDILDSSKEMRLLADDLDGSIQDNPQVKKLTDKINGFVSELEEIGCFYKDWHFTTGLVDFPSIIDGKEVYLCWKNDEEDVKFYHETEEGFAGRKPIPKNYFD